MMSWLPNVKANCRAVPGSPQLFYEFEPTLNLRVVDHFLMNLLPNVNVLAAGLNISVTKNHLAQENIPKSRSGEIRCERVPA